MIQGRINSIPVFLILPLGILNIDDGGLLAVKIVFLFNLCWYERPENVIAVAKTSNSVLNKSGKSGHLCLVPDLGGKAFNFSPLVSMGTISIELLMLSYQKWNSSTNSLRF